MPMLLLAAQALCAQTASYQQDGKVLLPDPAVTPGKIRTADAKQICAKDFRTAPYRKTNASTKKKVYAEYGVEPDKGICRGGCEVDHLVPLELGGADDIRNLWPQPSQPAPGFHEKDKLENFLHRAVCEGKISLPEAQRMLMSDWYEAFKELKP